MIIPNPLHPLLPHFHDFDENTVCPCNGIIAAAVARMATDGQVEEKPASAPRPIEIVREWLHPPMDPGRAKPCSRSTTPIYLPPQKIPEPCESCGEDGFVSRGIVERDANDGTIYRRDGRAVPREKV